MQVHVIHGEQAASEDFARLVRERFGFPTDVPAIGQVISLTRDKGRAETPPVEEPQWERSLARILEKAARIRSLMEGNSEASPDQIKGELERDLAATEQLLDRLLERVPPA